MSDDDRRERHQQGKCDVVVEIPRGSRNKYEASEDGTIWFDRRLGGPAGFPGDYGYIIGAEGEDGDALDALVLIDEPTFPGVHVPCRTVGASRSWHCGVGASGSADASSTINPAAANALAASNRRRVG